MRVVTRSEMMIRAAEQRAAERAGERTGVRMSVALKRRAEACAKLVGDELGEWVNLACRRLRAGEFDGVAFCAETIKATRGESEKVWVRCPKGMGAAKVRLAIASACEMVERIVPSGAFGGLDASSPYGVEGRDYLVEREA